jgi:hypothetical protein
MVVYNGKLYAAVRENDAAGIYRLDDGNNWTLVSSTTVGRIVSGDTTVIDKISLIVYNGLLFAGVDTGLSGTGNVGALYYYDGTTWTLVNATRGTFGAETNVDGVSDITVWNGRLYLTSRENNASSLYRYDGNTTFTRLNATVGKGLAEATADIDAGSLVTYQGNLWWGAETASTTARIYKYDGNTFVLMNSAAGTFNGVAANPDVTALAVFNNQLFVATGNANSAAANNANIFVYKGGPDRPATPGDDWLRTTTTTGRIDNTADATDVDSVQRMTVYNGRLYAGSSTTGLASFYEYTGVSTTNTNGWTKVNATRGTIGSTAGLDAIQAMVEFNGTLYIGTYDTASNNAGVYTYSKTSSNSYALKFASDANGLNLGSISFVGSQQALGNAGHTGTFQFSNGISTTTGAYDLAEDYPTRDHTLAAGDIVSIDPHEETFVQKGSAANADLLVGVYSTNPALRLSQVDETINSARAVPIALAGRVPVKVSTENGPVLPGDPITISPTKPGVGVRATGTGRIIGMSMGTYTGDGIGSVTVFLNPSYYTVPTAAVLQGQTSNGAFIDINVSGTATIDTLVVSDEARIKTLKVSGVAEFGGDIKIVAPVNTRAATIRSFIASEAITPGKVVILDEEHDGQVKMSEIEEDTRVIGVAVTQALHAGDAVEVAVGGSVQVVTVTPTITSGSLVVSAAEGSVSLSVAPKTGAVLGKATSRPDANQLLWILITLH